ncbi:MAG: GNAT family N-acetyltransferase [Ilumatobacteraceae bacterium]
MLRDIDDDNREIVTGLRVAPGQEGFVSTVAESLQQAADTPEGNPWFRAIYDGDTPVGFVMLSWNVEPDPPDIIGPWFLWKLLIDADHQGRGHGAATTRHVADLIRAEGATDLLTSHVDGTGGPGLFYRRLGFEPTSARRGRRGDPVVGSQPAVVRLISAQAQSGLSSACRSDGRSLGFPGSRPEAHPALADDAADSTRSNREVPGQDLATCDRPSTTAIEPGLAEAVQQLVLYSRPNGKRALSDGTVGKGL